MKCILWDTTHPESGGNVRRSGDSLHGIDGSLHLVQGVVAGEGELYAGGTGETHQGDTHGVDTHVEVLDDGLEEALHGTEVGLQTGTGVEDKSEVQWVRS